MTDRITLKQVNEALEQIVAEKDDDYQYRHVEGTCVYTNPDGSASCIVGQVLDRFGIKRPAWPAGDNTKAWGDFYHKSSRKHFTDGANDRLAAVQNRQDSGMTWKAAIA